MISIAKSVLFHLLLNYNSSTLTIRIRVRNWYNERNCAIERERGGRRLDRTRRVRRLLPSSRPAALLCRRADGDSRFRHAVCEGARTSRAVRTEVRSSSDAPLRTSAGTPIHSLHFHSPPFSFLFCTTLCGQSFWLQSALKSDIIFIVVVPRKI